MKTDRPDWGVELAELADECSGLIRDYEADLAKRKCVIEVTAGELVWRPYGKDGNWRIFFGEKPAGEAKLVERVRFGELQFEALSDAADSAMEGLTKRISENTQHDKQEGGK